MANAMYLHKPLLAKYSAALFLSIGVGSAHASYPSQEKIASFNSELNTAEAESKSTKAASSQTVEFLQPYLADSKEFPGAIERARAALALFRINPESDLAQKNIVELMS
jgi:hypothetical protein